MEYGYRSYVYSFGHPMEYGYRAYVYGFWHPMEHGYRAYIVMDTLWNMDIEYVYSLYTGNFGNSYL